MASYTKTTFKQLVCKVTLLYSPLYIGSITHSIELFFTPNFTRPSEHKPSHLLHSIKQGDVIHYNHFQAVSLQSDFVILSLIIGSIIHSIELFFILNFTRPSEHKLSHLLHSIKLGGVIHYNHFQAVSLQSDFVILSLIYRLNHPFD